MIGKEQISIPIFSPVSVRKVTLSLGTVFHQTITLFGCEDIAFHDSCADTADLDCFKMLAMSHDVNKADLRAITQFTGEHFRKVNIIFTVATS